MSKQYIMHSIGEAALWRQHTIVCDANSITFPHKCIKFSFCLSKYLSKFHYDIIFHSFNSNFWYAVAFDLCRFVFDSVDLPWDRWVCGKIWFFNGFIFGFVFINIWPADKIPHELKISLINVGCISITLSPRVLWKQMQTKRSTTIFGWIEIQKEVDQKWNVDCPMFFLAE